MPNRTKNHRRERGAGSLTLARYRERWFYLLIAPWLFGLVFFQAFPLLASGLMAFVDWQIPQAPRFVGMSNFQQALQDPIFARALWNTAYYSLGVVPAGIVIGLGLALLVNRPWPLVSLFRAIFFLPVVLNGVATTLVWGWVLNPQYGVVNQLLKSVGVNGPGWLWDKHWAMPAIILMSIWNVGLNMVVYLAALQSIPGELQEAAVLDGANRLDLIRFIHLPLVSPVTFYLIVVNLIGAFQVFTPAYLLTRGGPENATLTLPLYIYLNAFSWGKIGYASTLAVFLFGSVFLLTLFQLQLAERWVFYRYASD
jgi:multiple sugar transport system permease protein